jgi:hypothetical protein
VGRPTKFTDTFIDQYLKAIGAGVPPETAARHAGASPASLYRFLSGAVPRSIAFREAHDRALASLEIRLAATISKAALTDPKWAFELLRQRFPERWARARSMAASDEPADRSAGGDRILVLDPQYIAEAVPLLLEAGRALRGLPPALDQIDTSVFEDDGMPRETDDPAPDEHDVEATQ